MQPRQSKSFPDWMVKTLETLRLQSGLPIERNGHFGASDWELGLCSTQTYWHAALHLQVQGLTTLGNTSWPYFNLCHGPGIDVARGYGTCMPHV